MFRTDSNKPWSCAASVFLEGSRVITWMKIWANSSQEGRRRCSSTETWAAFHHPCSASSVSSLYETWVVNLNSSTLCTNNLTFLLTAERTSSLSPSWMPLLYSCSPFLMFSSSAALDFLTLLGPWRAPSAATTVRKQASSCHSSSTADVQDIQ